MPRFYFDIKNGHRLIDPSGLDCSDDDDAIAKATEIAAVIARDSSAVQRKIAILDSDPTRLLPSRCTASTDGAAE